MGKKQATTSPVKNSKVGRWLRRFIILVGILAGLWLVNFLTWLPAYVEVWNMARDPMAEKGVFGLKAEIVTRETSHTYRARIFKKEHISIS